jgi:hypothetical protein
MAAIHILEGSRPHTFRIVVHSPVPVGNNSAGMPWQTCIVNSGQANTRMMEGTGPGQITPAEKAQVESGALIERQFDFMIDTAWTNAERNAALDAEASKLIAETEKHLADTLKWYGATRA